MGRIIPYIMENKKCLKPPTRWSPWNHHQSHRCSSLRSKALRSGHWCPPSSNGPRWASSHCCPWRSRSTLTRRRLGRFHQEELVSSPGNAEVQQQKMLQNTNDANRIYQQRQCAITEKKTNENCDLTHKLLWVNQQKWWGWAAQMVI